MADNHGVAHGVVLVDGVNLAVRGSADLSPRVRGDVHAVVDAPVPGGLIVAQRLHGVGGDLLAGNRRRGLERLLRGGSGGCTLSRGGRGLSLGLGSQHRDVLGFHGSYEDVFPHGFLNGDFLRTVGVSIVYIAGDPDGGCAQDQGYVVALSAAAGMFVVAHLLSTSEADYCRDFRRLNIKNEIFRDYSPSRSTISRMASACFWVSAACPASQRAKYSVRFTSYSVPISVSTVNSVEQLQISSLV